MLKVSFNPKEAAEPGKEVKRFNQGKVTIVTLRGYTQFPHFIKGVLPDSIADWVENQPNMNNTCAFAMIALESTGKAIRADEDKDDPVFAERIAEARAKLRIYKLMRNFCQRVLDYYTNVIYGPVTTSILNPDEDTLWAALSKYRQLYNTEKQHLNKLLAHESDTESSPKH